MYMHIHFCTCTSFDIYWCTIVYASVIAPLIGCKCTELFLRPFCAKRFDQKLLNWFCSKFAINIWQPAMSASIAFWHHSNFVSIFILHWEFINYMFCIILRPPIIFLLIKLFINYIYTHTCEQYIHVHVDFPRIVTLKQLWSIDDSPQCFYV